MPRPTNRHLGGKKTAAKNLAKDPDYYRKLGSLGGSKKWDGPRGFARMTREEVQAIGAKGGRNKRKVVVDEPTEAMTAEAAAL